MKLKVINMDGKKVNDIEISDKIFALKPNKYLIQSLIDWQLNDFKARVASLDHIGASFFFEACLRSLTICKTIWLTNRIMPFLTQI